MARPQKTHLALVGAGGFARLKSAPRNKTNRIGKFVLNQKLLRNVCILGVVVLALIAGALLLFLPKEKKEKGEPVMVEITMKDGGVILLELDAEAAPITVENFVQLVEEEFYDGLIFHRIIPDFMVQGGDPTGTGMGGPGHQIKGEFKKNGWDNPISHKRGVISMARSKDPDSAGSQFFITHGDASFLDGNYAAFGHVVEGMDVVDRIAAVPTDSSDRPLEDVVIESIRVVEAPASEG